MATGFLSNFAAVMSHVANAEEFAADRSAAVMQGLAEAVTPGILGTAILSIAWLIGLNVARPSQPTAAG